MRLCLALGNKSLKHQRRYIDAEELRDWHAYEHLYGFPTTRMEAAVALSGSALCQTWGAKVTPKQLMAEFDYQPKVLKGKEANEYLKAFAMAHNKKLKKRDKAS